MRAPTLHRAIVPATLLPINSQLPPAPNSHSNISTLSTNSIFVLDVAFKPWIVPWSFYYGVTSITITLQSGHHRHAKTTLLYALAAPTQRCARPRPKGDCRLWRSHDIHLAPLLIPGWQTPHAHKRLGGIGGGGATAMAFQQTTAE